MNLLIQSNWLNYLKNVIVGFFAIIPQTIYLIYASMASLIDLLQLLVRKLVGLDSYYIDGKETSGDILMKFFKGILGFDQSNLDILNPTQTIANSTYSAFTTVFYSMLIFGVIILILSTIFTIIRGHYNYDEKKSSTSKIIFSAIKGLMTALITPIVIIFGGYLVEICLQSLDKITTISQSGEIESVFDNTSISKFDYGDGVNQDKLYVSYDMFACTEWSNTNTFSGYLFSLMTYSANRVRRGEYTLSKDNLWDNCDVFSSNIINTGDLNVASGEVEDPTAQRIASQIDYAFVNCLTLKEPYTVSIKGEEAAFVVGPTFAFGPSAAFSLGLINVTKFSKYNVGLVWYYYDLWGANYLLGFGAGFACLMCLLNLVFGLTKRMINCIALFLVFPPICGLTPLDEGKSFNNWKNKFISFFIGGFGAVVGLNILFMLLPFLYRFSFFGIKFIDYIFNIVVILAGLTMVKNLIGMLSEFIGSANLESEGESTRSASGALATNALKSSLVAVNIGVTTAKTVGFGVLVKEISSRSKILRADRMVKKGQAVDREDALKEINRKKQERKLIRSNMIKNTEKKVDKVVHSKYLAGITSYLGFQPYMQSEEVDENGNIVQISEEERIKRSKGKLKKGIKDIGLGLFKAVGDVTGLKNALKSMAEKGLTDDRNMVIQSTFELFGQSKFVDRIKNDRDSDFITDKQKSKLEKEESQKEMNNWQDIGDNSNLATDEIRRIIINIKKKD